ncbi:aldo/keto reductase [Paenibacillus eucommiae]|uniref:Aryl-alcohol dehydrogenase-like predicted oxidoreductase n=1 Tax=Paenibacillus eucommiae TaxID=1355755 RepID=A0ABS4J8S6_9BACL|nr:aldo/keto reductase [Paenibacillus eucommiae]MBP1995671.1 aryl-alcohol dehydrogenase-like predicted oxidoreductase [Paenibacillus eucommiae]
MNTIQIKGLAKPVSQLIMGTDFFRLDNPDEVAYVMEQFLQIGGNTIDTALVYCGGESEQAIGRWLRETGKRADINILTKGAHPDATGHRVNAEAIRKDLAISLERLGVDSVEMYALHRDDTSVPVGAIIEALNEHLEAGSVQTIGASNWTHERLQEAAEYAEQHGLIGFSFSSPNLSLAKANEPFWAGCVSADQAAIDWHEAHQLPLLSWSSQARGFFTGRFTPDNRENADLVRVFYSDDNWERLRRAEELAGKKGVTTIQIALAFVLNQSFPTCALIGPRNEAEMRSCLEGAQLKLTPEELAWLDLTKA